MRTCLLLVPAIFLCTLLAACSCPPPAAEPAPPNAGLAPPPPTAPATPPAGASTEPVLVGTTSEPGTAPQPPAAAELPGRGRPCADGRCAAGLDCVRFYGVAGKSGPEFTSCETRCDKGAPCPDGHSCATIADGPGLVCRPNK